MGPGRKPKSATASKPVQVTWQLTVVGGMLKVPTVVESVKEHYKGRDITFVPVAATTPWLCEMVAGQCASTTRTVQHYCHVAKTPYPR